MFSFLRFASVAVLLLFSINSTAQPPSVQWSLYMGWFQGDLCYKLINVDGNQRNFLLIGISETFINPQQGRCWAVKFNARNGVIWSSNFGHADFVFANCGQQTSDGGYIIAGSKTGGPFNEQFYLAKLDSYGIQQWETIYGIDFPYDDKCYAIEITDDQGYIMAGTSRYGGTFTDNFFLVKTDSVGNLEWSREIDSGSKDRCFDMKKTRDGGYILAGYRYVNEDEYYNVWLVKTNSLGDTIWTRTFGESLFDEAQSVIQITDGGYVLAGAIDPPGFDTGDFLLLKTDSLGNEQWRRSYSYQSYDICNSLQETFDGGFILAGETRHTGYNDYNYMAVKTNSSGDSLWGLVLGDSIPVDNCYSVIQTPDSGYILGGVSNYFIYNGGDAYLVKLSPQGQLIAEERPRLQPESYALSCYPNPFNPTTTLVISLEKESLVTLKVYDLAGRLVRELLNERMQAGEHSIEFNGEDFTSGIYFARIETGTGYTEVKKLVLLK